MDEDDGFGGANGSRRSGRRSARNATGSSNGTDSWSHWRGERRSSRLGAPVDVQLEDLPRKRARTEESIGSLSSTDLGQDRYSSGTPQGDSSNGKRHGAASVKPSEVAVEQVGKKKKSKFWFYAVEPIPGAAGVANGSMTNGADITTEQNGHTNGGQVVPPDKEESAPNDLTNGVDMIVEKTIEGSLSPVPMSP